MNEFFLETSKLLEEINNAYTLNLKIGDILNSFDEIFILENDFEKIELIDKLLKKLFNQNIFSDDSTNRIIWRIKLLKEIINFKSKNIDFNYLLKIAEEVQKVKIKQMIDLKENNNYLSDFNKIRSKKDILELINNNKKIQPFLKNLHDKNHPHYFIDLDKILELTKNSNTRMYDFFLEFKEISINNELMPYAIGYLIKNIKKITNGVSK
jgi:hypothetical protein